MTMGASTQLTTPVTDRDHIRGIDSAAVTLVEYGDYACPHCNEARFVVKQLHAALGGRLRYVFRNFPILTLHSSPPSRRRGGRSVRRPEQILGNARPSL